MNHHIVGFIQGNTKWYLSNIEPPIGKLYKAVIGIELAAKFTNGAHAENELSKFILDKKVRATFIHHVNITEAKTT